jgi:hypothetical protein
MKTAWSMGQGAWSLWLEAWDRCFLLFTNYFLLVFLWNADATDELRSALMIAEENSTDFPAYYLLPTAY